MTVYADEIPTARTEPASAGDFFALLKPRVMALVIFTGWAGLAIAPGVLHPVLAFAAVVCIALTAGGAGALNMWYERELDARMRRTQGRPLPAGRVDPSDSFALGAGAIVAGVTLMGLAVNMFAASLLAFTAFYYVVVYTMWLKPRTPQNIVIGGAAGAFPPMIGWVAVTGSVDPMAIALFMIIMLWTPPHSWALALFRDGDYAAAGIPMLPVVAGVAETKRQIVIYTVLLLPVTVAPVLLGSAATVYAATATIGGAWFSWRVWQLTQAPAGETLHRAGKILFGNSIGYLFALFLALVTDRFVVWLLGQFGG